VFAAQFVDLFDVVGEHRPDVSAQRIVVSAEALELFQDLVIDMMSLIQYGLGLGRYQRGVLAPAPCSGLRPDPGSFAGQSRHGMVGQTDAPAYGREEHPGEGRRPHVDKEQKSDHTAVGNQMRRKAARSPGSSAGTPVFAVAREDAPPPALSLLAQTLAVVFPVEPVLTRIIRPARRNRRLPGSRRSSGSVGVRPSVASGQESLGGHALDDAPAFIIERPETGLNLLDVEPSTGSLDFAQHAPAQLHVPLVWTHAYHNTERPASCQVLFRLAAERAFAHYEGKVPS
jgi:hypothetical protein